MLHATTPTVMEEKPRQEEPEIPPPDNKIVAPYVVVGVIVVAGGRSLTKSENSTVPTMNMIDRWLLSLILQERNTILHTAVLEGSLDKVKGAIAQGVKVEATNHKGYTALDLAAQKGYLEIVQHLVEEQGAKINRADKHGWLPLHSAACNGYKEVVQYLVEHPDTNVNVQNRWRSTILHLAAQYNHLEIVQYLVGDERMTINAIDDCGFTTLHQTTFRGCAKVAGQLIEYPKIEVNATNINGRTALHIASEKGYLGVVLCLLGHAQIDIDARDASGRTALYCAARYGHHKVFNHLLAAGANVYSSNDKDDTLLHAMLQGKSYALLTMLRVHCDQQNKQLVYGYVMRCEAELHLRIPPGIDGIIAIYHSIYNINAKGADGKTALNYLLHKWEERKNSFYGLQEGEEATFGEALEQLFLFPGFEVSDKEAATIPMLIRSLDGCLQNRLTYHLAQYLL